MAALLSVSEITSTADIAVKQRRRHRGIGFGPVVEPGLEYRGDALIEAGVKAQGASASRLQPLGAILFAQAHQAEANPQGLLVSAIRTNWINLDSAGGKRKDDGPSVGAVIGGENGQSEGTVLAAG